VFWERWSREFQVFPEVFGDAVRETVDTALPPDEHGWREMILSFEHEKAAAHRLAGFGAQVEVLSPPAVREHLLAAAQGILSRYGNGGERRIPLH
jgi:predicted DNA-binding transcriptional regulator YafY